MPGTAVAMAGEARTLPLLLLNVRARLLDPLSADLFMDVSIRRADDMRDVRSTYAYDKPVVPKPRPLMRNISAAELLAMPL